MRYLKVIKDGWVFEWDAILALNPACMEVTEQEAYPERFADPVVVAEVVAERKKRGRPALALATEEAVVTAAEEPVVVAPDELAAQIARLMP